MSAGVPGLQPYAAHEAASRGRRYQEKPATFRGEYQRDRDRIIHSTAFRRLMYKTQVFVNHEGDLYRTRLTHSLEVAQIARTVACALGLNEALAEAISLAHDLGHTPFGHAGQDMLNACMREYGGFEHNLQSLRVVDELEQKYAAFPGLNLTFESREGILKHCSARNARALGDIGQRFLDGTQPGLEAQLVNLADAIAYNNHDVDDGYRAGLLNIDQLREQPLFGEQHARVIAEYPQLDDRRLLHEVVRRMINYVVTDLVENTRSNLVELQPASIEDVRRHGKPLVQFSDSVFAAHTALKRFLNHSFYRHEKVKVMTDKAKVIVQLLFERYMDDPTAMAPDYSAPALAAEHDETARARIVADYIAGMTDRFAIAEYERLASPTL
ncbi:MAG TPA: deoxyguanosinetriphosphate triphosphohydrolase [Woeseiaceae bacterium]